MLRQVLTVSSTFETLSAKVKIIDLEPIAFKLVNPEEGIGWSIEKTDQMIELYRSFLVLNGLYPEQPIVPTKDLDKVWHTHILDTVKYAADCDFIFGQFFHHFPYLGLRGEQDAKNLETAFSETRNLFRKHFKQDPALASIGVTSEASCGGGSCSCGCSGTSCGGCADDISFGIALTQFANDPVLGKYADNKDRPRLNR
jgi:hypothetical protein